MGSPPRVRGKASARPQTKTLQRITPACAGKSAYRLRMLITSQDHPRVCGEKCEIVTSSSPAVGSPPRVRGKAQNRFVLFTEMWITPACAGKSNVIDLRHVLARDHPRVCGEKKNRCRSCVHILGSPPRVRGKADFCAPVNQQLGITPACAGKRQDGCRRVWRTRDHPRVCGEKSLTSLKKQAKAGSPPRVRGKVFRPIQHLAEAGITPACAGKSWLA